jgi:D-alanyl-D-alanine carboxypeptidase
MWDSKEISDKLVVPMVSIAIILVLFLLYWGSMKSIKTDSITHPIVKKESFNNEEAFKDVKISAKSAVVWDIKNQKVIYSHNPDLVLPLASITKVMMAVTANDLVPSYTIVPIKKEFLAEEGDSGLRVDENWRLKDLLDFSLITSSNDGSRAIASVAGAISSGSLSYDIGRKEFVNRMNEKAKKIGLDSMYFSNENGLDADVSLGGAYGNAYDVAKLFEYALKTSPNILESTKKSTSVFKSLDNIDHVANNTNYEINSVPGILASKTGYTTLAGGNLAIVFDEDLGRPLIISVLGSTINGRFSDVDTLIKASRTYLMQ